MAVYFFDTSALAKRYLPEAGSAWVRQLLSPASGHAATLSRITHVELTSAVIRRTKSGSLTHDDAEAILHQFKEEAVNEFVIIDLTPSVLEDAVALVVKHGLRAYDSVQLATACELKRRQAGLELPGLRFVSADSELNSAATAEGLLVESPLDHQ